MSVENNGIAELATPPTPLSSEKSEAELIYVGFWRRVAAYALGGSPGKLIMNMRIAKLDGSPVGYKQASIRYSVLFVLSMLSSGGLVLGFFGMPETGYAAFTSSESSVRTLEAFAPAWYQPFQIAGALQA